MSKPAAWETLCRLLEEGGAKMTFSVNCCSGLIGERCQCWRCRKDRGEPVTEETEAEAERLSKEAQEAQRLKMREWLKENKLL